MSSGYSKSLQMKIVSVSKKTTSSIFEYLKSGAKIIPVLGLDFSQANLTFDDNI